MDPGQVIGSTYARLDHLTLIVAHQTDKDITPDREFLDAAARRLDHLFETVFLRWQGVTAEPLVSQLLEEVGLRRVSPEFVHVQRHLQEALQRLLATIHAQQKR